MKGFHLLNKTWQSFSHVLVSPSLPISYSILRNDSYVKHGARGAESLAQCFTISSGWHQDLEDDSVDRTAATFSDLSSASYMCKALGVSSLPGFPRG